MRLFRKRSADRELDAELCFHLDQQIAAHLASGLSPEEARRRAHLEFGGFQQAKESVRDINWLAPFENVFRDIRFGLRQLRKNPGFAMVAIFTLALGIGANTAIFTVVYSVLLRPLPFPHPERILQLNELEEGQSDQMSVTAVQLRRLQDFGDSFESLAGYTEIGLNLASVSGPEHLRSMPVSAGFFSVLAVRPARGRDFLSSEDAGTGQRVAIIGHDLWMRRWAGDPTIVGQQIQLSGEPYTLIGIMPKDFDPNAATGLDPGLPFEVWIPLGLVAKTAGSGQNISVIARLKPAISAAQLALKMNLATQAFRKEFPDDTPDARSLIFVPYRDAIGAEIRPYLLLLFGAIGFVLLIACANVASLFLVRGEIRNREIAVRSAVGASNARIFRQLLVESLLLSLCAGIFGLLVGKAALALFLNLAPVDLPRANEIHLDAWVLCFTFLISLLTGIFFGTVPSMYSVRSNVAETLKENLGKASAGKGRARLRRVLVIAEFALSLVLLTGAGLMIATFAKLLSVNPGFDPHRVITMQFWLSGSRYKTTPDITNFYRNLEQRVSSIPGVEAAGIVTAGLPLERGGNNSVRIAGPNESEWLFSNYRECSPSYFHAMGIGLQLGREFLESDTDTSDPVVVVNETFVHRYLHAQNALDRQVYIDGVLRRVVGVASDVHSFLDKPPVPSVFIPAAQASFESSRLFEGWFPRNIVARTSIRPASLAKALRDALSSADSQIPAGAVLTMDQKRSKSLALQRFLMSLLSIFGGLALFLASIGMYGVIAYTVSQRTRELGIRIALGASASIVMRSVLNDCLRLVLVAAAVGLAGVIALRGTLDRIIFGISPSSPLMLVAATALLIGVALFASYLPARRATRVDPVVALRYE